MKNDITTLWKDVVTLAKSKNPSDQAATFLGLVIPQKIIDDVFIIGTHNNISKEYIENRYMHLIEESLFEITNQKFKVEIVVYTKQDANTSFIKEVPDKYTDDIEVSVADDPTFINPEFDSVPHQQNYDLKYTFDSFVVGESNQFARAAALAVAEKPGQSYNPLFIWGRPGLGKTHLLIAIANYVEQNYPHMKVVYITSEQFVKEVTEATRLNKWDEFMQKYRTADVLLMDDIQFLQSKEGTMIQLFNTFNELTQRKKQVVLSADRAPKDIDMDERLRSRFLSGLLVDVQPPNFETRFAIIKSYFLRFKRSDDWFKGDIPEDVMMHIAEVSTSNIREIEGALNCVFSYMSLSGKQTVNVDETKEIIKNFFPEKHSRKIEINTVQHVVEKFYEITHEEIVGSKRSRNINYPRQIAMYLARTLTDESYPNIGKKFGGRDHTTVMHGVQKIETMMKESNEVYDQIQQLTNTIKEK